MNFIHFLGTDKRFSFICHFSHIKYCVAHSAQRGIDALSCDIRYFLETQVVVISQLHNISLCFGQTFVYNIDLFFYLSVHHVILYVFVVVVCRHNRRKQRCRSYPAKGQHRAGLLPQRPTHLRSSWRPAVFHALSTILLATMQESSAFREQSEMHSSMILSSSVRLHIIMVYSLLWRHS